jgi:hypothetical protein
MPTFDAKLYVVARVSAGNADKTIPIERSAAAAQPNHLFVPLFDPDTNYYDIVHGPYVKTPVVLTVIHGGANAAEGDFFAAADPFVRTRFPGFELNQALVFGTSYWDGHRWIPLAAGQQAYAYPFKKSNSALVVVEQALPVLDNARNAVNLALQFLAVIQKG